MQVKTIKQSNLTLECLKIQSWGMKACESCKFKGKKNCGGKNIIRTGKNKKGIKISI